MAAAFRVARNNRGGKAGVLVEPLAALLAMSTPRNNVDPVADPVQLIGKRFIARNFTSLRRNSSFWYTCSRGSKVSIFSRDRCDSA